MASSSASRVLAPARRKYALPLGEGLFDGGEVGRIAWQKHKLAPFSLNSLTNPLPFMGSQVVHHDNLSRVQTRREELFHVEFKSNSIGRPLQDHSCSHALQRERGDQRRILAAIARGAPFGALSFWRSCVDGRERDIGATFIVPRPIAVLVVGLLPLSRRRAPPHCVPRHPSFFFARPPDAANGTTHRRMIYPHAMRAFPQLAVGLQRAIWMRFQLGDQSSF
jgi:hypothetical protein